VRRLATEGFPGDQLLDAGTISAIDQAAAKTLQFFRDSRAPNGLWPQRWMSGYLSTAICVLPVLAELARLGTFDIERDDPMFEQARAFLLKQQRPDDGFGETREADEDPNLAGQGFGSTPNQTAYAMVGLIASARGSSPEDDPDTQKALARAAAYLKSTHLGSGRWQDGRPLFTLFPQLEYFSAPEQANGMILSSLKLYEDYLAEGPVKAIVNYPY
jgi:squalene cyclase